MAEPLTPKTAPFNARTALAMATNRKESQRGPEAAWWGPQTDRVAAYEEADRLMARLSLLGFEVCAKEAEATAVPYCDRCGEDGTTNADLVVQTCDTCVASDKYAIEMLAARATQAEAQAAEMRDALNNLCGGCRASVRVRLIAECGDAGRTLLAELEALRELEQRARKRCDEAVPQWGTELREALAAVDAARKGE